jgi:3-hydroxyisobutyrate dehydrogenase
VTVQDEPCPEIPRVPVGFVGLGAIGGRMAERLAHCGVDLVVWNRTASVSAPFAELGARVATSPDALCADVDTVITCLHGPPSDRDVYLGDAGLLSIDVAGKLFVNTATVGPAWSAELAAVVRSRGAGYVDAPLMGAGAPSARVGALVLPVGGSADDFERALPLLRVLATTVEHVGDVGASQVVKLANNLQIAVHAAALAEALRMAVRGGADPGALGRLLPLGSSRSRAMELWLAAMLSHEHGTGGSLRTLAKDLELATQFADGVGEPAHVGLAAATRFAQALDEGLGQHGVSAIVEVDEVG